MSDDRLTDILVAIARLEGKVKGIEAGQTELSAGLTDLRAGHVTLRADLMARMDRLNDQLGATRDDISVDMGAVEQVR